MEDQFNVTTLYRVALLDPRTIEMVFTASSPDAATYDRMVNQVVTDVHVLYQQHPGTKFDILFDLSPITKGGRNGILNTTSHGRKKLVLMANESTVDRIAIVGQGTVFQALTNFMIRIIGKGEAVKVFARREAALNWLHDQDTPTANSHAHDHATTMFDATAQQRLKEIADAISSAVTGDVVKTIPVPESHDELAEIAVGFNLLIEEVQTMQQHAEERLAAQTTELQDKLHELERLNAAMVGRELKMIELKNEIAELKKRGSDA